MPHDHANAATESPPAPTGLDVLKDFQTRFLYPFFYERHAAAKASAALEAMTARTAPGKEPLSFWDRGALLPDPGQGDRGSHLYTDELFDHVVQYLFGDPKAGGCSYLRANKAITDAWFKRMVAENRKGETMELLAPLADGASIEVFLSPQGVGVLSVMLVPKKKDLSPKEASDFNYRLAQFRRHDVGRLCRPNPKNNPAVWQRMSEADKAATRDSPPDKALLLERLGALGGWFDLRELVHHLLVPLDDKKLGRHDVQEELMVYTVARFGPEADFAEAAVCDQLAPLLSGLAQVEEAGHTGSRPSEVTTANAMLNRRHWAAVGLLGSAHLISDQPGDVGFNESKLGVIRDKYFIAFLVALLRRLGLNRAIEEANTRLEDGGQAEEAELLESLRADQLKFAVRGRFSQISYRQVLHRYYRMAQEGLDVPDAWESVRRALADLDAKRHALAQQQIGRDTNESLRQAQQTALEMARLAEGMNRNLDTVTHVQLKVEQIEVVIISVYLAHLWHIIANENPNLYNAIRGMDVRYLDWFPEKHIFISWSATFVALISLLGFGTYLLRNWKWYKIIAVGAVGGVATGLFVLPWGRFFTGLVRSTAEPLTYALASLAAVGGAAVTAYLLKPWRLFGRGKEAPSDARPAFPS